MVGIPQYLQDKMENDEIKSSGGGGPVDEGHYVVRLIEAEEDTKATEGVNCTFLITSAKRRGHELRYNWLAFTEKAGWKIRSLFDAAGYTYDSEFEELIEDQAEFIAYVTQQEQTQGKNAGKMQNNIEEFIKLDDDSRSLVD